MRTNTRALNHFVWKKMTLSTLLNFSIVAVWLLHLPNVDSLALPRWTSPTYSREYVYWKRGEVMKKDSSSFDVDDEHKIYTFSQVFRDHGVERAPWKVPPFVWKWAYRFHLACLPFLHAFDDTKHRIPNSALSLPILWWKALLRKTNPIAASWAYDLLPRPTRWIVKVFASCFPPLHHINIQLRTTFLDNRTRSIINEVRKKNHEKRVRLVVIGAGYDLRSLRLLEEGIIDQAIEVDLPNVILAKETLLLSKRFQQRRPGCSMPKMAGIDLNDIKSARNTLKKLLNVDQQNQENDTFTIFLLEGILVHLASGSSSKVLKMLRSFCSFSREDGCLVFCDRIQGVNDRRLDLAKTVLNETGWKLSEFISTPTKTPHFGVAKLQEAA